MYQTSLEIHFRRAVARLDIFSPDAYQLRSTKTSASHDRLAPCALLRHLSILPSLLRQREKVDDPCFAIANTLNLAKADAQSTSSCSSEIIITPENHLFFTKTNQFVKYQ
ncbi:hypothetical protein [Scytonema sp. NUACC26]|uniref:hypothetical protein n=1 Tax=Scytonema sp. NUACC26 TaxID=3140176 RepID=UPI0038B23616